MEFAKNNETLKAEIVCQKLANKNMAAHLS